MNQASFGRKRDQRNLLLRNLAASVILYESVTTTAAKARSVQPIVERLFKIAQNKDRLQAYRQLNAYLPEELSVRKLLDELVPRYKGTNSGYTRRYALPPRKGDGSPQTMVQLTKNIRLMEETKKSKPEKATTASEATPDTEKA